MLRSLGPRLLDHALPASAGEHARADGNRPLRFGSGQEAQKEKVKFNAFGCVNVGSFCKNSGQCCSGICEGKKGKKKCQDHDTSGCQADQDACLSEEAILCTTSVGSEGICLRTTGNASYCGAIDSAGKCFPCNTDVDCQEFCGPTAACLICEASCEETGGTICTGLDECTFPPT